MASNKRYIRDKKTPQNASKRTNIDQAIVARIIDGFKDRNRAEIKKWRQALDLAANPETPRLYVLQDLYDNLASDGHYISERGLRKAATLCSDFSIINRQTGKIDQEKTELFKEEWFFNFCDDFLDSIFRGYTLLELTNPEKLEFTLIPRRNVVPAKQTVLLEATADRGINYGTGFESTLVRIGKTSNLGLMADLCGQLIWKRNAQQSWAEFSEKFGMPLITATTNKTSQADIDKIQQMLAALGEAARAVLPEGTTIDIKPFAGNDAYKVFDLQIERINTEISKPIVGGTMVTGDGSSRSQSEVHERNLDDKLALMDKLMLEFTVNGQLIPILQSWGHPINPLTEKLKYESTFELSVAEHWDVINSALGYYDIPDDWVSKTFNFPITGRRERQHQPVFARLDMRPDNSHPGRLAGGFAANFQ
jgi:phage gp29-like protein